MRAGSGVTAAAVVWLFVDGLGVAAPATPVEAVPSTPCLDAMGLGRALLDGPDVERPGGGRWALDATLGVDGLPGTATGQASLLTGHNASAAMGRHVQAYPGPQMRAFIDRHGTVFSRLAQAGMRLALLTAYPPQARETALRYAARMAGAPIGDGAGAAELWPHLDAPRAGPPGHPRFAAVTRRTASLVAGLAAPYDLAVVESDLCDRAGHLRERREAEQRRAVAYVDAFVAALRDALDPGDVLVVTSDHGNAEDLTGRGHTRNRVPLWMLGGGQGRIAGPTGGDLTAFAPWLERLVRTGRREAGG